MFDHACEHYPDKIYLAEKTDSGWLTQSYHAARENTYRLTAALAELQATGPMAILAEGRPSWVIAENSTFLLGSFSVPLSIKLSADEISFRIIHSKARMVCCSRLTHEKILSSRERLPDNLEIIYLDNDPDTLKKLNAQFPHVHTYQELVARGELLMENPKIREEMTGRSRQVRPEDVATVSYTSGTTGNPKGIMLTHSNYYHNCRQSLDGFPMPFNWRMFVILPIDHAFAHTIALYASLLQQFSLYFVDARGGAMGILRSIPVNLKEVKPDIMLTVPSLTTNFMQKITATVRDKGGIAWKLFNSGLKARIFMNGTVLHKPPLYRRILPFFPALLAELLVFRKVRDFFGGNLKLCIGGGAHLDIKQQEFFRAIGIPVFQGYGLTEASPVISTNNRLQHKIGTSGPILPGIECKIMDDNGHSLPADTKGMIAIRGPNVMKGYLYNDEATSAALIGDGWLVTGDLGKLDSDGYLHVIGREKALLIASDGEKYSPEEMEDAIVASSRFIAQCMLWCDHKNYTSSVITLRIDELKRILGPTDYAALKADSPLIQQALDLIIQDFSAYTKDPSFKDLFPAQWKPACFMIAPRQFTEADGMINSTMKMVRSGVMKAYEPLILQQYEANFNKPNNQRNREFLAEALKTN